MGSACMHGRAFIYPAACRAFALVHPRHHATRVIEPTGATA